MFWLLFAIAGTWVVLYGWSRSKHHKNHVQDIVFEFSSLPEGVKENIARNMFGRTGMALALTNKECLSMANLPNLKKSHIVELLCELVDDIPTGFEGHFEMFHKGKDIDTVFVMFHKGSVELQSTFGAADVYFRDVCLQLKLKHEWNDADDLNYESLHIAFSDQQEQFQVYSVVLNALHALDLEMGRHWIEFMHSPVVGYEHTPSPSQVARYKKLCTLAM